MQTTNINKPERFDDHVWQSLAEFPLREFLLEHDNGGEIKAGLLFQSMRGLGIPVDYLKNIELTLTGFAEEGRAHLIQGNLELPGHICVFCQKKMIDDANSTKTSRLYNAEQAVEHAQIFHPSGSKMNEGWGYYVIERGGDFASIPCNEPCRIIELYIYREGK